MGDTEILKLVMFRKLVKEVGVKRCGKSVYFVCNDLIGDMLTELLQLMTNLYPGRMITEKMVRNALKISSINISIDRLQKMESAKTIRIEPTGDDDIEIGEGALSALSMFTRGKE